MTRRLRRNRRVRELPRVFSLERIIDETHVDPEAAVAAEMKKLYPKGNELRGMKIGITAVSRQVANYLILFRACIAELRARGAEVYVIPAIGSHGGGTAEGNLKTLANFGITEATVGAKILSAPETSKVGIVDGVEVHCLNTVLNDLDGLFLFGRVRRHWDIRWAPGQAESLGCYPLESGLMKLFLGLSMLNAKILHGFGDKLGWAVQTVGRELLLDSDVNVIGALALVDNEEEQTALVKGIPFSCHDGADVDRFLREELEVLNYSKRFLPYFPFIGEPCDLLYLHYFGKPYAGQGADSKITGANGGDKRWCDGVPLFEYMCASRLIGSRDDKDKPGLFNAMGVGNLDMIPRRFHERIDWELTRKNADTANVPNGANCPLVVENDRDMLEIALGNRRDLSIPPRMMFAVSTVWMRQYYLTEAYYERALELDGFRVRSGLERIPIDEYGFLAYPTFQYA